MRRSTISNDVKLRKARQYEIASIILCGLRPVDDSLKEEKGVIPRIYRDLNCIRTGQEDRDTFISPSSNY